LEQMTIADWKAAILPKVAGTWNLHNRFQHADDLDFFIMLSSLSGIIGLASQSNYAAGGTYQDAVGRWRVAHGLPAVSIDLGAVKDVGYVAETAGVGERMKNAGHRLLEEDWVLRVVESAILAPRDPQLLVGINNGPGNQWDSDGQAKLGSDPRFLALKYHEIQGNHQQHGSAGGANQRSRSLASKMAEASSRDDAERLVSNAIADKLADIFMIPVADVDLVGKPLTDYGVDSLVAMELRNMLILHAAVEISIFNILRSPSLLALASDVVAKSTHVNASLPANA
jgi:hypothetical protein